MVCSYEIIILEFYKNLCKVNNHFYNVAGLEGMYDVNERADHIFYELIQI